MPVLRLQVVQNRRRCARATPSFRGRIPGPRRRSCSGRGSRYWPGGPPCASRETCARCTWRGPCGGTAARGNSSGACSGRAGGVHVQAELVLERDAADVARNRGAPRSSSISSSRVSSPCPFTTKSTYLRVERSLGVERWKVAAPNDGNTRVLFAEGAADRDRLQQLRTGHH